MELSPLLFRKKKKWLAVLSSSNPPSSNGLNCVLNFSQCTLVLNPLVEQKIQNTFKRARPKHYAAYRWVPLEMTFPVTVVPKAGHIDLPIHPRAHWCLLQLLFQEAANTVRIQQIGGLGESAWKQTPQLISVQVALSKTVCQKLI